MVKNNNLWNFCPNTAVVKLHRTLTKFRNLTFFEVRAKYTDLSQNNGTIANLWSFCAHSVLLKLHKMRTKFRNLILATHSKCGPIMDIYHIKTADCANLWTLFASKTSQTTCKIQWFGDLNLAKFPGINMGIYLKLCKFLVNYGTFLQVCMDKTSQITDRILEIYR